MVKRILIIIILFILLAQVQGASAATWTISGSGGNAPWSSFSQDNVTEDLGSHGVKLGLFADNFDDNDNTGWTTDAGTWSLSNGRLKQTYASGSSMVYCTTCNFTNFEIIAKINRTSEGSNDNSLVGLFGRKDTATRYYIFDSSNKATDLERIRYEIGYAGYNLNTANKSIATQNTDFFYRAKLNSSSLSMKYWKVDTSEPDWEVTTTNTTIVNGSVGITVYLNNIEVDDFTVRYSDAAGNVKNSGNLTTWYDSGSGNLINSIAVNVTTPTNTNYSVWYRQNATGDYALLDSVLTGNNSFDTTDYRNIDVRVVLNGNETVTPEITQIVFYTSVGIPNITSWSNTNTSNSSLVFTIIKGQYITFNATANQSVTWTWNKVIP